MNSVISTHAHVKILPGESHREVQGVSIGEESEGMLVLAHCININKAGDSLE
jgi:hypothetical protein